jgi:hypothetical protein
MSTKAVRLTAAHSVPQRGFVQGKEILPPLILPPGTEGELVDRRERVFYGAGNKCELGMFNVVRIDNEQWHGWAYVTDAEMEAAQS